ncbi:DUF982 domain-containing protein [Aminobacter sp. SR38]|uniref:DUF982 domain-containing protein n=1 Tax=Aminobacter sp. SR38 TaxID=2774562 RepID=UPI0017805793|nr:DUF982 domain-containing protein [Aminobacter sp. SR38]QOF70745.1 DUF982 domain-containing protein [Aminobacter sp. SR38]
MFQTTPVSVRSMSNSGLTVNVKSCEAAIDEMDTWPKRTAKWRLAYQRCYEAIEDRVPVADARKAFEAAAKEAGVLRNHP